MKKTLAIVLALVMVLAMIPAMSAVVEEKITKNDGEYELYAVSYGDECASATVAEGNTITLKYEWKDVKGDVVSKWAEKTPIALVRVAGFDAAFTENATFTIDGKVLKAAEGCEYADKIGYDLTKQAVVFPVELTKAGYTDTFLITVTETNNGKTLTENAKVTVVLKNVGTDPKGTKTAVVTNIESKTDDVSAYIVGDKIYFDYINEVDKTAAAKITFADENGKAFSVITYAQYPLIKNGDNWVVDTGIADLKDGNDIKLDKSAQIYRFDVAADADTLKFVMETEASKYETKAYTVKMRANIKPEDPKGIYFAENTKTIAMGEKFAPVVVGVKTGKPVAAKIFLGSKTDAEVIDVLDQTTVIGTREGVAYITATYKVPGDDGEGYVANAMKVIVTLPGESIPEVEPAATIYYVTCRNLNVRAGAGTSYKKVDMIHRGDAVKVLEIKNGWAKVADGTYVCAKYIAK